MQSTALKEAQKHVLFHHENADGWVTIAKKDAQTGRFKQYHYQPEELAEALTQWLGEDVYYSQNTFYKPQRRIDTIRQLRSLYVDLDVYTKGLKPDWVLQKLEYEVFGQDLPDPNMVIFSGRGLVLIWNIVPVPYMAMPLWKSIENYFVAKLKELGSDSKASDPTRIFRIAGSVNSKNNVTVKAEYRHTHRYELRQLQYEYLPELDPKKISQKKPGRKTKVVHLFNIYTLHLNRAKDIAKLVELRNGDCKGYRETICFLYRYFTCCWTNNPQRALADTMNLNMEFITPLPDRKVINATKSAEKAWEAKSNQKANEAAKAMGYPGAGYNIPNKSLIEWLSITEEEQQHMLTIISPQEKKRRKLIADRKYQEQKRREKGMRTMAEYNKSREKQVDTKLNIIKRALKNNPKLSVRQIAEQTGISKSTVSRILKQL